MQRNGKSCRSPCWFLQFLFFLARLFCLPRFISFSIHATNGSAGRYSIKENFSNPRVSSTAFAASMPVRQARSKKKEGAG